jgi:hypothetical protein
MRALRATLLAAAVTLAIPASASAATTIGSTLPGWTGETLECTDPSGCTFVPRTIGGTPVVAPHDGVVVRWSALMPSSADTGPIFLRVIRPTASGAAPVGSGVILTPPITPGALAQTSPLRSLAVKAGDTIGVELNDGDEIGIASRPSFDSSSWFFAPRLSSERPPDSIDTDDFEALFNAAIEPDADGDGYGDETRDRCPLITQEHLRPCTEKPSLRLAAGFAGIGRVAVGKSFEIIATVGAPSHATPRAALTFGLPAAVKPVAIRGTAFCNIAGNSVTCPLGDIPARARHTVVVEALALRPAITSASAELTTGLPAATSMVATDAIHIHTTKRCGLAIRSRGGTLSGTVGGDRLIGSATGDELSGLAGADCLMGGSGADVLDGGEGDDDLTGGRGEDLLRGGPGNDRIEAFDRMRDVVRCGDGRDRARVDRVDSVAGCEAVTRVLVAKKKPRRRR